MATPKSQPADPFAALRAEIDTVDAELVRLLAHRFNVVKTIGAEKAKRGMPVRVPERIQAVHDRIHKLAVEAGLPPEIAGRLWHAIIEEACALEEGNVEA